MKCSKCWLHDRPQDICPDTNHRGLVMCEDADTACRAMRAVLKMARRHVGVFDAIPGSRGVEPTAMNWARWATM